MYYDKLVSSGAIAEANHVCPNAPNGYAFGVSIRSKFFSGGFGFHTFTAAFEYATTQSRHATRDGLISEFHAAIADRSHVIAIW